MRVVVVGATGQLGRALVEAFREAPGIQLTAYAHQDCDLTVRESIGSALRRSLPDVVINAAAFTAVDAAEDAVERADRVNARGPGWLAAAVREQGGLLIHFSTDYVFDGTLGRAYRPDDPVSPINAYGRTKALGEQAVVASGCAHLILRTSWLYARVGGSFVARMLHAFERQEVVRVVADRFGSPTSARQVARFVVRALASGRAHELAGRDGAAAAHHVAAPGRASWYDLAAAVRAAGAALPPLSRDWRVRRIDPISASDWPTRALRPVDTTLDSAATCAAFGQDLAPWREALDECLRLG